MLEVAKELVSRGHAFVFSSSGEVAELIRRRGYQCRGIPLADVRYSEAGEFALMRTLAASPSILTRTCEQVVLEVSNIRGFDPDVVLSDSALSTVIAARSLGVPTLTVLNQLNLGRPAGGGRVTSRMLSAGLSTAMGRLWELSDEVLLPDLPPPYTISEKNLWGSNVAKVRYIGFLGAASSGVPDGAVRRFQASKVPRVFWQVSGPPATRPAYLRWAFEAARALKDEYSFVISGGDPSASAEPVEVPGGYYYGWCEIAGQYFGSCDVVVARAGHGTIGQALLSSKPSLLVPIPRQPEQEGNAAKAARLGISIRLSQDELSVERLGSAFGLLLQDGFRMNVDRLSQVARAYDARGDVVTALETAAGARRGSN
jgi:UDP-N-acetylglucosamine--N-acetylmuramyl-(pentapeptide) pyrophosphoryl-undecaprenol N-acetylglucosamine transferase